MPIYTKILIGMLLGAVIGALLGPHAPWLPADVFVLKDASQAQLFVQRDDATTTVQLPKKVPIRLYVAGEGGRAPEPVLEQVWVPVRLAYDEQLALHDLDSTLHRQLSAHIVNGYATVWLKRQERHVDAATTVIWPKPVSSIGDTILRWLAPVGDAFLRLIKMVIVPLVFASLLVGVASLGDLRKLGRLGSRTMVLYLLTTGVAVSIGVILAKIIQPGTFIDAAQRSALLGAYEGVSSSEMARAADATPSITQTLVNIIPVNPIAAFVSGDMLQIIFFALIAGIALTQLTEGQILVNFFDKVQQIMIKIIHMVMHVAPFGVAALIAQAVGTSGLSVLKALAVYGLTVILGLFIHCVVVYGGLLRVLGKMSLRRFVRDVRPAHLIAFSTASSSATLPVSIECAEKKLGVSAPIASFVLPLGATINMDGSALYQGVAAIFIAQAFQLDLSFSAQMAIILTTTISSIGTAGVPGASIVMLAMVLTAAGIPAAGVALILGMDRFLDMFRTVVNITGDLVVSVIMARSEGEALLPPATSHAEL